MKNRLLRAASIAALCGLVAFTQADCSRVGPGEVGVRVHTMGSDRGVDKDPLGQGIYYTGAFTDIYTFPTYTQNYNWTESGKEGSSNDESIFFSDSNGINLNTDIGISYHVDPDKAVPLFLKYRKGIDEITNIYLRNMVRDALIEAGSEYPVDYIYGEGRGKIIKEVQADVTEQVNPIGIKIEKIYWIGKLRMPKAITDSINGKVAAVQRAIQRENEVKIADAQAQIDVAQARGHAQANRTVAESITPELVEYLKVQKWDGHLPRYSGGSGGFLINDNTNLSNKLPAKTQDENTDNK